ncbi:hypothetical protein AB0D46_29675 [Streptomyces sp. NPDC048383]|uniref:hypothetical protein n=1 Tax=Streptomyces sp. NPDC048383 TaxID=3155386 RepID=UPI003444764C
MQRRAHDGPLEHVFSTEDRRELRAHLDELTRTGTVRAEDVRVDVLCGRPARTTHHQVSGRIPEPEA